MSDELASLLAKKFIARRDVKAIQTSNGGAYVTVEIDKVRQPWKMDDLRAHLEGTRTYGHYLLDEKSNCKFFAFDIDLRKTGWLPKEPRPGTDEPGADPWASEEDIKKWYKTGFVEVEDLRACWLNRSHPGRPWMKLQFKVIASKLARVIHDQLALPCAVAYSGAKGIHVYGFTGYGSAYDARLGANIALETVGDFEAMRGSSFFKHKNQDPVEGFPNLSIEVFPKQDTLADKDLGNLMRLPLGRNRKSNDPTFFVDMTTAMREFSPIDPIWALGDGALNVWRRQDD